jgi:hypothetical protein
MRHLTWKVEGVGHKLLVDNFFPSPNLFSYLKNRKINCCKAMPHDFRHMTLKMKWNDIQARTGEI